MIRRIHKNELNIILYLTSGYLKKKQHEKTPNQNQTKQSTYLPLVCNMAQI